MAVSAARKFGRVTVLLAVAAMAVFMFYLPGTAGVTANTAAKLHLTANPAVKVKAEACARASAQVGTSTGTTAGANGRTCLQAAAKAGEKVDILLLASGGGTVDFEVKAAGAVKASGEACQVDALINALVKVKAQGNLNLDAHILVGDTLMAKASFAAKGEGSAGGAAMLDLDVCVEADASVVIGA